VTQVDITKIDRDFFGVSGLWSELVYIVGHEIPSSQHLYGWYVDGYERFSSAPRGEFGMTVWKRAI
jgi:hypothetical protein